MLKKLLLFDRTIESSGRTGARVKKDFGFIEIVRIFMRRSYLYIILITKKFKTYIAFVKCLSIAWHEVHAHQIAAALIILKNEQAAI